MEHTDNNPTVTDDALKAAVEEAEQRGYLRGLNEAASSRMEEPAPYETIPSPGAKATTPAANDDDPDPTIDDCDFFTSPRRSIWD